MSERKQRQEECGCGLGRAHMRAVMSDRLLEMLVGAALPHENDHAMAGELLEARRILRALAAAAGNHDDQAEMDRAVAGAVEFARSLPEAK